MRKIVFDIETKNIFTDVGSTNPADLDISVVCLYDYEKDSYHSFLEKDFPKLWPILEKTELLIGYNSNHFDIPLLNKYCPGDLTKVRSLDILHEIRESYGRRMKLDQVAEGTLNAKKSGNGLQAVYWWKSGEIDKIIKYCLDYVRITKEVYDYAIKNNGLKFKEGGKVIPIKLNTSKWEEEIKTGGKTSSLF